MTRPVHRIAWVVLLGLLVACGAGQDPGVPVAPAGGTPTTSRLLPACPPGGPDDTTPPAGCVGPGGEVLRPGTTAPAG